MPWEVLQPLTKCRSEDMRLLSARQYAEVSGLVHLTGLQEPVYQRMWPGEAVTGGQRVGFLRLRYGAVQ